MSAIMNWTITQLDCVPQEGGKTDVVVVAHWQCVGTEGSVNARVYGTASFTLDEGGSFTPYDQLTQAQVLGWVWQSVDKTATEEKVQELVDAEINPPVVTPPLPWPKA